jgi:hypothetical protein
MLRKFNYYENIKKIEIKKNNIIIYHNNIMDNLTEEQREKYRIMKKCSVIINWFRDRSIIKYFKKHHHMGNGVILYECPVCNKLGPHKEITKHIYDAPMHIEYIYDKCFEDDKKTLLPFVDLYNVN